MDDLRIVDLSAFRICLLFIDKEIQIIVCSGLEVYTSVEVKYFEMFTVL